MRSIIVLGALSLSICTGLGCATQRHDFPPPEEPSVTFTPTPAQARARADAWAREDAESEQHSAERAAQKAAEDAARASEDERIRAELAAHPFSFDGDFHAGKGTCPGVQSLKFRDIRSLTEDCQRCSCEYAARRSENSTVWTAQCRGGKPGTLKRKLVVSSRRAAAAPPGGVSSWHATFEQVTQSGGGAITCGYVGWLTDRTGEWKQVETQQVEAGPGYEMRARSKATSDDPSLE